MPISFKGVSHIYSEGTPYRCAALTDVDLDITEGKFTAVIGQTGSGKSTLVQHLNALLLPSTGTIEILDRTITAGEDPKHLKSLRGQVGLVFQFPENQLFEETVLKDVAFGPKNFGCTEEEAEKKAKETLRKVGLDASFDERSPLELSGGQKRRVAIADILVMDPKVIVLDEPTAGLDPQGAAAMMSLFQDLNEKENKTILMVTHDMEQVFRYCSEVVVMQSGKVRLHASVQQFFQNSSLCREMGILPPSLIRLKDTLKEKGFEISDEIRTIDEMAETIAKQVKHNG